MARKDTPELSVLYAIIGMAEVAAMYRLPVGIFLPSPHTAF